MEEENIQQIQINYLKKKVQETIAVSPQDLRDTKTEIKKMISQKLFKYDISLGGIPITHKNIKISEDKALIHDEQPHIFLPVQYKARLFQPKIGDILPGTVTQVFQSHIGVLIFNVFNAIIHQTDINNKIFKINSDSEWIDSKTEESIEIGSEIQFEVKDIKIEENGDFQIEGSILSAKKTGLYDNIKVKYQVEQNEELNNDIQTNMENIL